MINRQVIKNIFWERNSIDIQPFIGHVVRLTSYPLSNPDKEEVFVGSIEYDENFPMLRVGFPWYEGEKTSFAKESAVSPDIDDPKAYYILKSIEHVPDDVVDKWFAAGSKYCKNLLKDIEEGKK